MGEGNVLTHVCPSMILSVHRGVPISHNALQHFPECHEAAGGYPEPPWGGTWSGTPPGGVYPDPPGGCTQTPWGVPGTPPRVGQQKEYSLHGGRYASCVHTGGLSSCLKWNGIIRIIEKASVIFLKNYFIYHDLL